MKVRVYSELEDETVAGVTGAPGRTLVPTTDNMGYRAFEIRPTQGRDVHLAAPDRTQNHVYFCLHGLASVSVGGATYQLGPYSLLALPPATDATLTSSVADSRLMVVHVPSASSDPASPPPLYRTLSHVRGTARDVAWGNGNSRRFLVKADGFNLGLHSTLCKERSSSQLWYRNHLEACYYIRGEVRYDWDGGQSSSGFKQDDIAGGDGWLISMDQHDPHTLHSLSQLSENVSLFYPPLVGDEVHTLSPDGYSAY